MLIIGITSFDFYIDHSYPSAIRTRKCAICIYAAIEGYRINGWRTNNSWDLQRRKGRIVEYSKTFVKVTFDKRRKHEKNISSNPIHRILSRFV